MLHTATPTLDDFSILKDTHTTITKTTRHSEERPSPEPKKKKRRTVRNWKSELLQVEKRDGAEILSINGNPFDQLSRDGIKVKSEDRCQYRACCGSVEERAVRRIVDRVGMLSTEQIKFNSRQKIKATCSEKYGCENPSQSQGVKDKKKATCLKNHGCEHPGQSQEVKEKMKVTCLEKFGCENPSQSQGVKDKRKATCLKNHGYENPFQSHEVREEVKATCLEKFGCENPSQSQGVKDKKKATCLKNHGCEYSLQSQEVREKGKATCLKRFGCEHPMQSQEVREKGKLTCLERLGCENPFQSQEVMDKIKATNLERLGCENPSQSQEVRDKMKATCLERLGCEHPMQSQAVKDKIKTTNLKRFGCEYSLQSQEVRDKGKATCMERFGCEHPMQNAEVLERQQKNGYRRKPYTFGDNTTVEVQGYEVQALKLLEEGYQYTSADFIQGKERLQKTFPYCDSGKSRVYHPDIPTLEKGRLQQGWIEVKSIYTFRAGMEKNCEIIKKGKAVIDAGYNFSIWVIEPRRASEPVQIISADGPVEFANACTEYYHERFGLDLLPRL